MNFRNTPNYIITQLLIVMIGTAFLCQPALGQNVDALTKNYKFSHFTSEDGLPQNSVLAIHQDQKGFLWMGTDDGLSRFDGFVFKTYRHNSSNPTSLSSNVIRAITAGKENLIWIGTEGGGVNVFDPETERFYFYEGGSDPAQKIYSKKISSIIIDNANTKWIGTQGDGFYKLSASDLDFKNVSEHLSHLNVEHFDSKNSNLKDDKIWSIYQGKSGLIYIGTLDGGAYFLYPESSEVQRLEFNPSGSAISSVKSFYEDDKGNLWLGTEKDGLWLREKGSIQFQHIDLPSTSSEYGNTSINITSIRRVENELWVGTLGSGLYILTDEGKLISHLEDKPSDPYSINGNSIYTSYQDRNHNIWLGMYSGEGLNKVSPSQQQFEHYRYNPEQNVGLSSKMVKTILKDSNGHLWVGLFNGGVNILPMSSNNFDYFNAAPYGKLSYIHVQTIIQSKTGKIWIGTDGGGITLVDVPTEEVKYFKNNPENINSLSKNEVWAIAEDSQGMIWVGMANGGGLNRIDPSTGNVKRFNSDPNDLNSPNFSDIRSLIFDSKGNLWIGTYGGGLNKMNSTTKTFSLFMHKPEDRNSISNNIITSLLEDKDGAIWIGTFGGGLNRLNPETGEIKIFTVKDGLPSDIIKAMLQDDSGQLWISTVNGLSRMEMDSGTFRNYTEEDGLQSNEFNLGSAFKDDKGKLYFGGTNGFNAFYPERISPDPIPNAPTFTRLNIFNQEVNVGDTLDNEVVLKKSLSYIDELQLSFAQNNFEIDFSSLEFFGQNQILFSYKLEGFDKNWITTQPGRRFATYSNVPHGEYILKVKSIQENNVVESSISSLRIAIIPPWYLSIWAWMTYFILLIVLIYIAKKLISWRIKLKNDLRFERLEKQKQEEVNQLKLSFFTNISHELRTPLMLINAPLEKLNLRQDLPNTVQKQLSSIQSNSNRLLRLINQLLDFRKQETGNLELQVEEVSVKEYMEQIAKSFEALATEKKIHFKLKINATTPEKIWLDQEQFQKVMFNLIYNAFKFVPENGEINVVLESGDFIPPNDNELKPGILFSIEDNGPGIPKENISHLFERFYQIKRQGQIYGAGTGIGLALAKSLVDSHAGILDVTSEENQLTVFKVYLQQGNSHFKPENIILKSQESEIQEIEPSLTNLATPSIQSSLQEFVTNKPPEFSNQKILVVEDNPELLELIRNSLLGTFSVVTASNGKEALAQIETEKPDLVISDVMMPEMDGTELCAHIKANINTSHLQVILLTAKGSYLHQLEGYESGADDYLVKPFQLDLLVLKVKNLLFSRTKFQLQFSQTPNLEPARANYTSTDQKFLATAMETVEKNIDNNEFSVNDFVQELGMSRTLIFEKFKALSGLTPNDFIQTVRLKRAAQLIIDADLKIAEIGYSVGFSNPKYFSKCFLKQFGKTPSAYKKDFK